MLIFVLVFCGSAVAASAQNSSTPKNVSLNHSSNQSSSHYEGTPNDLYIRGYWINNGPSVLNTVNVAALKKAGITDLFISTNKDDVQGTLVPFLNKFSGSGIRIHAWVSCFRYDGKWYDPGTNPSLVSKLKNSILSIANNYNIDGIHLDAARYPGTAYKYDGTTHVTSFVSSIYNSIQTINNKNIPGKHRILLSAALMPETNINAKYYGQDYSKLAPYLDFMAPMIYKGNYGTSTQWIASTTKYIVDAANGTPVVAGLQTYRSDEYPIPIPEAELNLDIQAAIGKGSAGYVLFKYGLTDTSTSGVPYYSTTEIARILTAAASVKNYIEKYEKLPSTVTLGTRKVDTPTFLYLLSKGLINVNGKNTGSIRLIDYNDPTNPSQTVKNGSILKKEYLAIANNILNHMKAKGSAPNYASSSLGNIPYKNLIYAFSKILNYYDVNNTLPSSVSINSLSGSGITDSITVIQTSPTNNAVNLPGNTVFKVIFNKNIIAGSMYWIELLNSSNKAIPFTKSISGNVLTIKPNSNLAESKYKLVLHTGCVTDQEGNPLALKSFTFSVGIPPKVTKTYPSNNATKFSLTASIVIAFNKNIKSGTNYSGIYIKNLTTGKNVSFTKTISGKTLILKMISGRLSKNMYQVYLPARVVNDAYGNSPVSSYTFKFKTI